MKRLRVCVIAALGSFASFVAAPPLSSQSSVIDIGTLGSESSFLWAVNNRNQAVGWGELTGRDTEHTILQGSEEHGAIWPKALTRIAPSRPR